jgi:DNA end-binding protein Ku
MPRPKTAGGSRRNGGRAIWKGTLLVGKQEVPIKMYSAVEDRKVHFRLLHAKDLAPVEQRIVRKDTGKEVRKEDLRKAHELSKGEAVILQPDELEQLEPTPSREIHLCRCVAPTLLNDQWYERPYYLGPDDDEKIYFALAQALESKDVVAIARWVMRKKRYLGAIVPTDGYLMMVTLRRADQVLTFSGVEPVKTQAPTANELKLAERLVSSIEGDFEPELWKDEYHERVCKLIEAKSRGEKLEPIKPKRMRVAGSLADTLKASIAAKKEKKVA